MQKVKWHNHNMLGNYILLADAFVQKYIVTGTLLNRYGNLFNLGLVSLMSRTVFQKDTQKLTCIEITTRLERS